MLHSLINADRLLFHRINQVWTHPWLDAMMPVVTDLHRSALFRLLLAPAALGTWLYLKRVRGARILLAAALAVGLADCVSYRLIKPHAQRPRPAQGGIAVTLSASATGYGMPSNHAANMFAAAQVVGLAEPALRFPFYAAAAIVAYSRVYVGVHYPSDVLAGGLLGMAIGWAMVLVSRRYACSLLHALKCRWNDRLRGNHPTCGL